MTAPSQVLSPAAERAALRAIADFQSDTAEILSERLPLSARLTLHVVAGLVATGLVLAAILPIDRVVTSRGRVTSVAPKIVVQPLETSIIRNLRVREGQVVKAGEVLATLDATFSTADVSMLTSRIASLEAEIGRYKADLAGITYVPPVDNLNTQLQVRIQKMRQAEYHATLTSFDEKIAATQSNKDRAERELAFYQQRLTLMSEVEKMRSTLESKNAGTRMNTIEASNIRVEVERNVAAQQGTKDAAEHALDDLRAQRDSFIQRWNSSIAADLVDKQRQLDQAQEEFAKADKRRDLIDLKAVEDAVVLQVGDVSVGSVVESAQKIFTLVPIAGGLQVEVEIGARDQGFVKVGQQVDLKLDAWRYTQHGMARGVVRSISGDSFSTKTASGAATPTVFLALVDITEIGLRDIPKDFRLVPGMPLTADVTVGSRTLMSYFLEMAVPMMTEGLREP